MELTAENISAYKQYAGNQSFNVPAGKTLSIETSPDGEEILATSVPAGKQWTVHVSVYIKETVV